MSVQSGDPQRHGADPVVTVGETARHPIRCDFRLSYNWHHLDTDTALRSKGKGNRLNWAFWQTRYHSDLRCANFRYGN